nr:hypothetical protein [Bacteroidota bacterium]
KIENQQTSQDQSYLVTALCEDKTHNLWVATYGQSLFYLDTKNETYKRINDFLDRKNQLPSVLTEMVCSEENVLWIGSDFYGLIRFNTKDNTIIKYWQETGKNKLLYKTVRKLFIDKSGNLWIGTNGKGINILSPYSKQFITFSQGNNDGVSLEFSSVRSIFEDENTTLWVGGYTGLQQINLATGKTEAFFNFIAYTICPDLTDPDMLWIGTEGNGMVKLNKKTGSVTRLPAWMGIKQKYRTPNMTGGLGVFKIFNADENNLWIATEAGLHHYNINKNSFRLFHHNPNDPKSIISGKILSIYRDKKNRLWIGSFSGGLAMFNPSDSTFTNFTEGEKPGMLSNNRVNCIYEDTKGNFWIGTHLGFNLMGRETGTFKAWYIEDGLPNNVIYGILEDKQGDLWLSTNQGISQFNHEAGTFTNFDSSDGLPDNEFNTAAYFQKGFSKLYFGGVNGMVMFDPENIRTNPNKPDAVLTRVLLFNEEPLFNNTISYKDEIVLNPEDDMMTLGFSALQYINPGKNSYAYRFEAFGERWIDLGHKRSITLTDLRPGNYRLQIKAANNDGVWNNVPTNINIVVCLHLPKPCFLRSRWLF